MSSFGGRLLDMVAYKSLDQIGSKFSLINICLL